MIVRGSYPPVMQPPRLIPYYQSYISGTGEVKMYTRIRTTLQILSILASLFGLNAAVLTARYRSCVVMSSVDALKMDTDLAVNELMISYE